MTNVFSSYNQNYTCESSITCENCNFNKTKFEFKFKLEQNRAKNQCSKKTSIHDMDFGIKFSSRTNSLISSCDMTRLSIKLIMSKAGNKIPLDHTVLHPKHNTW